MIYVLQGNNYDDHQILVVTSDLEQLKSAIEVAPERYVLHMFIWNDGELALKLVHDENIIEYINKLEDTFWNHGRNL